MELHVCCSNTWAKARQKALEIKDNTLNDCIARIITMALPRQWEIEDWRKKIDDITAKCRKAKILRDSLENKYVEESKQVRYADKVVKIFIKKWYDINSKVSELERGGMMNAYLYKDGDLDFYFVIKHPDGKTFMNGGIIWHNGHWEIHT